MRVVIAPDSFKGSATAVEVAEALARGWLSVRPGDDIVLRPMADGGEGTLDAFESAIPGSLRRPVSVTGPTGERVDASWLLLPSGRAVVELATTSGLLLLPGGRGRPHEARTTGFGQAIAAALDAGATGLLLAIGSSSSTDGGAGLLQALGARLLDSTGRPIEPGARGLSTVVEADLSSLRPLPVEGAVIVSDVSNPLLGQQGAAAVFGPQKGATATDVAVMEAALTRFADLVPVDPTTPGAGAAGGAGFGLLAWGAHLEAGSESVAETIGLRQALQEARVVITGEGRFDAQSAHGKVPSFVVHSARASGALGMLVAGSIEAPTADFAEAASLTALAGSVAAAMAEPLRWLEEAGARLAEAAARLPEATAED